MRNGILEDKKVWGYEDKHLQRVQPAVNYPLLGDILPVFVIAHVMRDLLGCDDLRDSSLSLRMTEK